MLDGQKKFKKTGIAVNAACHSFVRPGLRRAIVLSGLV